VRAAGTRVEFRSYPRVGHGFGLGIGTSVEGWIADAIRPWENVDGPACRRETAGVIRAQRAEDDLPTFAPIHCRIQSAICR
jgi:hypothetical protein